MTFKNFIEAGGVVPTYREKKTFSPPAYRVIDPSQHHHEQAKWLVGIYSLLVHMAEAGEFLEQGNRFYVLQNVVGLKWHPSAVQEFENTGALVKIPTPMVVNIPKQQPNGSYANVQQSAYVYEVKIPVAQTMLSQDYHYLYSSDLWKNFVKRAWGKASEPRLPQFHGTKMFH